MVRIFGRLLLCVLVVTTASERVQAEGEWEVTPASELALERGLEWLARNQGPQGNWESNDLGLVGMGTLAFLAAGHMPGRGKYGAVVDRSLDYMLKNAKPSGLLNIANAQRDMYNHGLATFVLGQAHGMTRDPRMAKVLERSLKLIYDTQCDDGGWDYRSRRQSRGHDLSLGLEVPPEVVQLAIQSVRGYYRANNGARGVDNPKAREGAGQFTYSGSRGTTAMAAAGVVCLQEYGQYDDWRIPKNMEIIKREVGRLRAPQRRDGRLPVDAYTMYYVGQAMYQVGGEHWKELYPVVRDHLTQSQSRKPGDPREDGWWTDTRHVSGKPGRLYGTAVACFILAMPNRYLPILQEGKIESLRKQLGTK
jgi:hypothetical protein